MIVIASVALFDKKRIFLLLILFVYIKIMQRSNPIILTISNILDEIIKETDALELESNSIFHAISAPAITINNYL